MDVKTLLQHCSYLPDQQLDLIKEAFDMASDAHKGQKRHSGQPYISHPVAVSEVLSELEMDGATIIAGILHDVLEDTPVTKTDIESKFGSEVADLVDGVTKLGKLNFKSSEEAQAENFRKMFLAMAKDIRVVIIKLADRLHNMRTLKYHKPAKQKKIAKETRDIFSPLAHRLGIWKLKWELEDLTFYYLEPEQFQEIKDVVAQKRESREKSVEKYCSIIAKQLNISGIQAKIIGRPKHFFSIYKKMIKRNLSYKELYDTLGVRILVDDLKECYEALGIVHSKFKPISGRFKDYIAMPKSNMYQSLHTSVIAPDGQPVEIQIRTKEMHEIAEFGVAAHWRYKEGGQNRFDNEFSWLRQLLETNDESLAPHDYLQNLKVDLFVDEVFIFTPKGDVSVLPKGSTPVDFAYKVHTEVGDTCIGAKINGHIVTLNYQLKSGDRIEILTSKRGKPNVDWLTFVKTNQARNKIKQWLKRLSQEQNVETGRKKLEKALVLEGIVPKDVLKEATIDELTKGFKLHTPQEFFIQIAQGDLSVKEVVRQIQIKYKLINPDAPKVTEVPKVRRTKSKDAHNSVIVLGEENIYNNIAQCCRPVPGDLIIGYVTLSRGVSIHKSDCPHITNLPADKKERLIEVKWNTGKNQLYEVILKVEAFDRVGILNDILSKISDADTNMREVVTKIMKDGGSMRAIFVLEIKDLKQLRNVKRAIAEISDVYLVQRSESKTF